MITLDVVVQEFTSVTVTVQLPADNPVILAVVAELLHAKVYGEVPPVPLAAAVPSAVPLQLTFVFATVDAANTAGSVMVTLEVAVHELASDTVTVQVPAVTPVMLAVVAALLHEYVYGAVPPVALAVAEPLFPPLQLMFVFTTELATTAEGSVMVTLDVLVHEFASDTVTVYVPAVTPVMLAVVAELLQAKVYGAVPPVALAVADPSDKPLQLTGVFEALAANSAGSVIVTVDEDATLSASVTVTVYVPALTLVKLAVVAT